MISVIIPLYNKESLISNTIKTVLNQTFQDFEIVVVNDGSSDNSVAEVKKFKDTRIRVINQKNAGVSAARNRGIQEANGDYIALLDGDDEWNPDYLKTQYKLAQTFTECDVFAVNYEFHDINSGKIATTIINKLPFENTDGVLNNYFEVASCSHPPICSISVMARKGVFESIGGFPLGIKSGEDLLTWARLACRYKIAYCKTPLAIFNVEGYNIREKPKRIPPKEDYVGEELLQIKRAFNPPYINAYISQWHKNRASVFMRLQMRKDSIKESLIGLKYNPLNYKLILYIMINLLPAKVQPF